MAARGTPLIVCVDGLWHLGTVIAACLADAGHHVIGLDRDPVTIAKLREGRAPIAEPGLDALLVKNAERLEFTTDPVTASRADVVWIAYDTPVDDADRADVELVVAQAERLLPVLRDDAVVLISSQLPVGTTARLEAAARALRPLNKIGFACSPENLRLGKAIAVFTNPDRVVVGARDERTRARIVELLAPITTRIEWMSVESAEMTKHAINAFLAVSVTFANELASVCERVGADAKEVERGLKTESRIGPHAYVSPGAAFSGGTLARDVAFLTALGLRASPDRPLPLPLLSSVRPSNEAHKQWPQRRLAEQLGELRGHKIAVWGLTYKPGTDTLRRSAAIEMCLELAARGAVVQAWDPSLRELPAELAKAIVLSSTAEGAVTGASALVIATEWPEILKIELSGVLQGMKRRLVLDANRFLSKRLSSLELEYLAVGAPTHG